MSHNGQDISTELCAQVETAIAQQTPMTIQGGQSKPWYGNPALANATPLVVKQHRGITNYEPTELVLTARCGTPLADIEAALATENQQLPFEPPHFGETATLGGTIASNLSGPARPWAGAARDLVLGCRIINGKGEILSFGGEVMKNVAGYDVSRLMCGALGTLGVLLEVSLKVLPNPQQTVTVVTPLDEQSALQQMCHYAGQPLPINAACYHASQLYLRLAGTEAAVQQAVSQLPGETLIGAESTAFWQQLREHQLDFFTNNTNPLWRLSVPADTPPMPVEGDWLYDWGGAQRWLVSTASAEAIRQAALAVGGHATLYRADAAMRQTVAAFQPLEPGLLRYQRQLKQAFDPKGIFNPQRLYSEL